MPGNKVVRLEDILGHSEPANPLQDLLDFRGPPMPEIERDGVMVPVEPGQLKRYGAGKWAVEERPGRWARVPAEIAAMLEKAHQQGRGHAAVRDIRDNAKGAGLEGIRRSRP